MLKLAILVNPHCSCSSSLPVVYILFLKDILSSIFCEHSENSEFLWRNLEHFTSKTGGGGIKCQSPHLATLGYNKVGVVSTLGYIASVRCPERQALVYMLMLPWFMLLWLFDFINGLCIMFPLFNLDKNCLIIKKKCVLNKRHFPEFHSTQCLLCYVLNKYICVYTNIANDVALICAPQWI